MWSVCSAGNSTNLGLLSSQSLGILQGIFCQKAFFNELTQIQDPRMSISSLQHNIPDCILMPSLNVTLATKNWAKLCYWAQIVMIFQTELILLLLSNIQCHFTVSHSLWNNESWKIHQLLKTKRLKVGRPSDSKTRISFIYENYYPYTSIIKYFQINNRSPNILPC